MRVLILWVVLGAPLQVVAECRKLAAGDYGDERPSDATLFGGCRYFSPVIRLGWSSEHSEFLGLGGLIPLDQSLGWNDGVIERGVALMGTHYPDGNIFDVGFAQRRGWPFLSAGWDAGLSFRDARQNMRGVYIGSNFVGGAILVRYLKGGRDSGDSEFSIEIGLKY